MHSMALRVWSKLCCGQKWLVLVSPLFLLLLTISVMTLTLPLPFPPADVDRRPSRALSSAVEFRSRPRFMLPPPATALQQLLPHIHSGPWKSQHSEPHKSFLDSAGDDKNSTDGEQNQSHTDFYRNKHRSRGFASKRKMLAGTIQHPSSNHHPTANVEPKPKIKASSHSAEVKRTVQACTTTTYVAVPAEVLLNDRRAADRQAGKHTNRNADTQIHSSNTKLAEHHLASGKHRQTTRHSGKSDKVSREQQAMKKPLRDLSKHHKNNPRPLDHRKTLSKPKTVVRKDGSSWCRSFTEQEFTDSDLRRIRIGTDLQPPPWLTEDDIQKMQLLAGAQVVSKNRVPAHGQVLQVALDPLSIQQMRDPPQHGHPQTHSERCQQGCCSLIKRTDDWFEVFAFHLDRVLGLNRSLPAVLRTFQSDVLPYRYTSGAPRPIVWWDPDIQHLSDRDNDQNSVPLSWIQYQKLLQVHCGSETELSSSPCVGVHHSEWGRLALFDFLLQVNDRLDRYCCGFTPDPTESCVENLLNTKCGNSKNLLLVHILVRKADPSRLVFIDNAGRPQQPSDNLNFRLVEGIDEFPENAVSLLQSGCLESLLLRSLYTDREFWDSQGGARGLRPLIHMVEQRGKMLLQHIRDNKLRLGRDL